MSLLVWNCKNDPKGIIVKEDSQQVQKKALPFETVSKIEKKKILKIPKIGEYDLLKMEIDNSNFYKGGDCEGKIQSFAKSNLIISIDSLFCGDYGFNYTNYLYQGDTLQVVHQSKSDYLESEYILSEYIYDLRFESSFVHYRIDTTTSGVPKSEKAFITMVLNLDLVNAIKNKWNSNKKDTWKLIYDEN